MRYSSAIPLALLLLLSGLSTAAAAPSADSQIHLRGNAQVDQSRRQPQLLLSADATDGSGYHLEATLSQSGTAQRSHRGRGEDKGRGFREEEDDDEHAPLRGGGGGGRRGVPGTGADAPVHGRDGGQGIDPGGSFTLTVPGMQGIEGQVDHTFWYISRAAGLTAYLMLFLNVLLGLAVRTRFMDALLARWRSFDLHGFTGLLAMGFLLIHGLSLLGDRYVGFTLPQLLVPLASPYRPVWTAMGVIAFYTVLVVLASSYLKKQLGYRFWRGLHYLSFGAYLLALAHGVFAGTDSGEPWARGLYWSTGLTVLLLTLWRFRGNRQGLTARRERPPEGRVLQTVALRSLGKDPN